MGALDFAWPSTERRGLVLTICAALVVAFCIIVPRIGPLAVVISTMIVSIVLLSKEIAAKGWRDALAGTLVRPEAAFAVWVMVACAWSVVPGAAFVKAVMLAGLILHAIVLSRSIVSMDLEVVTAISRGLVIGFCVGAIYLFVEIIMADFIGRLVLTYWPDLDRGLGKHAKMYQGVVTAVSGAHMSRVSIVFCLFLCPAVLAAIVYLRGIPRYLALGIIGATSLVILFHRHSHSQTAELAIVVGLCLIGMAAVSARLTRWLAGIAFAGLLFLIVPLSLGMYAAKLHENPDIFKSGRARVVIWNYTAERILENPVFGIGTYSTRSLDAERKAEAKAIAEAEQLVVAPQTRAHPHNIYLHVWYELGVVGVLAFSVLGLSLLSRIANLMPPASILAIGHFGMCIIVISSTYGLWQNWFQAAVVFSVLVLIAVAIPMRLAGHAPASVEHRDHGPEPKIAGV